MSANHPTSVYGLVACLAGVLRLSSAMTYSDFPRRRPRLHVCRRSVNLASIVLFCSVFWDLYCAAPERRDTCEHSSEAKAFHDYGFVNSGYGVNGIAHNAGPAPSPLGQMPPNDGMPGGPMPPGFFPFSEVQVVFQTMNSAMRPSPPTHPSSQPSPQHPQPPPPHSQMMSSQASKVHSENKSMCLDLYVLSFCREWLKKPFMGPRYPGPRGPGGVRMPNMGSDFNGQPPGQPMMPNSMDPTRQGRLSGIGDAFAWQSVDGVA
ncbi:hypothetical protein FOCC_FOCC000856 [Frankliniella occidentalis]|nr:hypothetical protein FOCC_FOCC000856 [Frankliniella occidentalis]